MSLNVPITGGTADNPVLENKNPSARRFGVVG